MKEIVLKARAKINWTLDVISRRPGGYHNVDMLMQSIGLADRIIVRTTPGPIILKSNSSHLPLDHRNIAHRAVVLLKEYCGIEEGAEIILEKHIPIAAGLAGGSTDGAAVLLGLNRLWGLGLTVDELCGLGAKLGGDVPFCLTGGTARAQGIGEKLSFYDVEGVFWIVLVKPYGRVSTKKVYGLLDLEKISTRPNPFQVLEGLQKGNPGLVASGLGNVLETVTLTLKPEISQVKARLMETGALGSLMSGSGPSVYGIYINREKAFRAYMSLRRKYRECFLVPTAKEGITEVEK
jgi:4-diphosphocytidyl-2-C-methyl-D-erythritol kinase